MVHEGKIFTFAKEKLNINRWTLVEHTGTHMDAPLHFTADGHSVDEIPVTDFVVPLAVVDISQRAQDNPQRRSHTRRHRKLGGCKWAVAGWLLCGNELRLAPAP